MNAKTEQLKIDADSIPWKYTSPDGTKFFGQLRWLPHGYEQHVDLLLKLNFLLVRNFPDGPYSHVREPDATIYNYAVANVAVGPPISQVAYPPKVFHSLLKTQYESLVGNQAPLLAPKRILSAKLPSQQIQKRSCLTRVLDLVNVYYPHDFTRVLSSQGSEGYTQITKEATPSHSLQSVPIEGFASGPGVISGDFSLESIGVDTPQSPEDSTIIKQQEFQHYAIQMASSGKLDSGPKIKQDPPHVAIQLSSPGAFGSGLHLTKY
ncbi:hypothetical protein ACHAPC_007008 [Botrytis cinerea]